MLPAILNHLWQSTAFAGIAWLLTLALRKNHARVRHGIWLAASLKFLIPISLLIGLGSHIQWRTATSINRSTFSVALDQVSQPFATQPALPTMPQLSSNPLPIILTAVWLCGFIGIACSWYIRWRRIGATVNAGLPMQLGLAIKTISSPAMIEPGVFGIFRPILLLPEDIADRLTTTQLKSVIAHELCHVRHHDNLIAAIHMFVETVFWFHPLIWWIGKRMVEERELACDEEVVEVTNEPRAYAEGILNVCKLYTESPLVCVSGITGADLRKRIEAIMTNRAKLNLTFSKKIALGAAALTAIALPIAIGLLTAHRTQAQSPQPTQSFEAASIKLNSTCNGFTRFLAGSTATPGRLTIECAGLRALIQRAFGTEPFNIAREQVSGGPTWVDSARYQIAAKAEGNTPPEQMTGPMMRSLLEDRFKLKVHREMKEVPVYELTVAKGGPKLQAAKDGGCIPQDQYHPEPIPPGGQPPKTLLRVCGGGTFGRNGMDWPDATMATLCAQLSMRMDRDVIDKTGVTGKFEIHLAVSPDDLIPPMLKAAMSAMSGDGSAPGAPPADPPGSSFFEAVQKLGLKLESGKHRAEFLVIDHIEKPSGN